MNDEMTNEERMKKEGRVCHPCTWTETKSILGKALPLEAHETHEYPHRWRIVHTSDKKTIPGGAQPSYQVNLPRWFTYPYIRQPVAERNFPWSTIDEGIAPSHARNPDILGELVVECENCKARRIVMLSGYIPHDREHRRY